MAQHKDRLREEMDQLLAEERDRNWANAGEARRANDRRMEAMREQDGQADLARKAFELYNEAEGLLAEVRGLLEQASALNHDRIPGQNEDMAVDSQGYNPDPINRPMYEFKEEPEDCVFGPHLPGWPLVLYVGSHTMNHGTARVQETYVHWSKAHQEYQFAASLECDEPAGAPIEDRVLANVRLASLRPITPARS